MEGMRMVNANSKKDRVAPATLEKDPPAPAARSEPDWPDYMNGSIYFETEITQDQLNASDPDEPIMLIKGRVPIRHLSRFEYKMLVEFEALLNEKARS